MILAISQLNPTVGDIDGNARKIIEVIERARGESADVVLFPELAVLGYPPKDLLLRTDLVAFNVAAVERIAAACRGITAVVGFAQPNERSQGRGLFNAAAVCRDGRVVAVHRKCLLPTYDVFDESRYFEPSRPGAVEAIPTSGGRVVQAGITICEDLWNDRTIVQRSMYHENPVDVLVGGGAELIINIGASPFDLGKDAVRREIFGGQARRHGVLVACANQVGGNDDLVFDGASVVFDRTGRVIARAKAFAEDFLVVDTDKPEGARIEPYPEGIASVRQALTLGVGDYVRKCEFDSVVIGLSGGIDSAVTAAIAVEALGPGAVRGVALPSRYSSDHSIEDARQLAGNLGIQFDLVSIEPMHAAVASGLVDVFDGSVGGVTDENIQARLRGLVLMALCNQSGAMLLTTGNKSELAVGYCTMYGDMCGGVGVLSDVPKTAVYELARHINTRAGRDLIPDRTLTKPPSAELRPDQTDQDSLPPYDLLDSILKAYIEEQQSAEEIIASGVDRATVVDVVRRVHRNEYKRQQAAPGIKITRRAFGSGRRMPIAARVTTLREQP